MEIVKAQELWGFYSWNFTLPKEARTWIDENPESSKNFLKDCRRAVSMTIKETLGITKKTRGIQPGFSVLYHPVSSGNPFNQSSHFHALILPILVDFKNEIITKFEKRIDHNLVKRLYKKNLEKVFIKYGLHDSCFKDQYTVYLHYIEKEHESSINHAFRYNNRSQAMDVLKTIKRVQDFFEEFVCLLIDKQNSLLIPVIKSREQILDALEFVLSPPIQIRMSYGFMRVIEKYSILLGIERDDYEDDDNWETLFHVDIFRQYRNKFINGKIETVCIVFIRKKDSQEEWQKVKPDEIRGERFCMSNRKLYKARTS